MPRLGLSTRLNSSGIVSPGIVTDGLVMKHMYPTGAIEPLSDGAVYFVSGDKIVCPDSDDFTFTAGNAFSVGCWFNSTAIGTDHLIGKTNNTAASHANNEWYFHLASGGKLCLQCFDPSESAIIGRKFDTPLSSNTWYHGFATYDGGTSDSSVKIYLNGVRVDDSNQNAGSGFASMDNTATELTFARTANGSVNYAGYMCNAGIWSRELTEAEIKSIMYKKYSDLSTTEKTSLVSWWNLDSLIDNNMIDANAAVYDNHNTTLGSEEIDDGTFPESPTGWTLPTGWTWDSIKKRLKHTAHGGTAQNAFEIAGLASNKVWKMTADVTVDAGSVYFSIGGYDLSDYISETGTYTKYIINDHASQNGRIYVIPNGNTFSGSIDNISVKQVNGNTGQLI